MSDSTAFYFDGKSAARQDVSLRFEAAGIRIEGAGAYEFWAYSDIRYAGDRPDDLPLAFCCLSSGDGHARLVIDDRTTIETLRNRCPDLGDKVRKSALKRRGAVWSAMGIAAFAAIVWSSIHFLPGAVAPLVPVAWEETIGDRVVDQVEGILGAFSEREIRRCENPAGRAVLNGLVQRLTGQVESPYRIRAIVIKTDIFNALAAPGGRIIVLSELIKAARSPDEVAGVIAHEIGHVIARHPTEGVVRSMGVSLVFNILLGGFGDGGTNTIGQTLVSSAYSREAERDADTIAFKLLRNAGISTTGLADLFDRLAKSEGSAHRALSFVSSHPHSEDRAQTARAANSPASKPALTNGEWRALRRICDSENKS